jgi:hypothetical protein
MEKQKVTNHWEDDKLGRVNSANFLTTYLNGLYSESSEDIYLDSFVMNINAGWGFGKTFFLKHWIADLKEKGHPVVYFDAWVNDYSENPLLAFMAELEDAFEEYKSSVPKGKKLVENIFKSARKLIAPTLSIAANALTRKVLGDSFENIKEAFTETDSEEKTNLVAEQVEKLVSDAVENAITEHRATKSAIENFKKSLIALVEALKAKQGIQLPIYILIDELDRCRPTYAIELLEGIKHIFGVNGVFFIVATNKAELSHSISAVYGNGFDSSGYLRRFFDQEYVLPKPNNDNFANYLIQKYRLDSDSRFFTPIQLKPNDKSSAIAKTFSLLAGAFSLSPRDQIQVVRQFKAIILSSDLKSVHMMYLVFLIMYKQRKEKDFDLFLESTDGREMVDLLKNSFDIALTFDGGVRASHGGTTYGKVNLKDTIMNYKSHANVNAISLYEHQYNGGTSDDILHKLREEAPSSYQPNQLYPLSIGKYPELVRQAGHLI